MIGRRAVVGLSLFSALLFCAFAAQSASAAKSVNTTMVTCIAAPNNDGDFVDAHCDEKSPNKTGAFTHSAPVELNKTTEIAASNQTVTESTKKDEPAVLTSQVGLTKVEISCTMVTNEAKNSLVHNAQTEEKHTLTGTVETLFTECTVGKPSKCKVKEAIKSIASVVGVEGLGAEAKEMGAELVGTGAEETFAEITFEGAECALKEKTFKVKGSVIGTSGPTTASSQENHWSGATVVFTPEKEMEKLKLGVEPAKFSTIVTQTNAVSGTPIAGTTWTATN